MPEIASFVHNGMSVETHSAPPPMGPLGSVVLGVVGTAPDADPLWPKNSPIRIANMGAVAKLDMAGTERGTLYRTCYELLRIVSVPVYVVIVEEGTDAADTTNKVIGKVDPATGQRTGIQALSDCQEVPTHIAAPGFNTKPVADALAAMGKRLYAIPVGTDLMDTHEDEWERTIFISSSCSGFTKDELARLSLPDWNQLQERLIDFLERPADYFRPKTSKF
ncbi:hypothetical protein [Marinomonas sp.]|uniref:hypothetical protein n=1 Tax=Marinomonas sp. TaxID=1904862 RepID=UPI003BAD22FA